MEKIILKDIYEGQNTFEGEVYLLDFLELMHSNEKVIIDYISVIISLMIGL